MVEGGTTVCSGDDDNAFVSPASVAVSKARSPSSPFLSDIFSKNDDNQSPERGNSADIEARTRGGNLSI